MCCWFFMHKRCDVLVWKGKLEVIHLNIEACHTVWATVSCSRWKTANPSVFKGNVRHFQNESVLIFVSRFSLDVWFKASDRLRDKASLPLTSRNKILLPEPLKSTIYCVMSHLFKGPRNSIFESCQILTLLGWWPTFPAIISIWLVGNESAFL